MRTDEKVVLAGNWMITGATVDGISQPEWQQKSLSFEQLSSDSGRYTFTQTLYDSIWPKSGGWLRMDSLVFMRSDGAALHVFQRQDSSLSLILQAEWLLEPYPCTEDICLPALSGSWVFDLERER